MSSLSSPAYRLEHAGSPLPSGYDVKGSPNNYYYNNIQQLAPMERLLQQKVDDLCRSEGINTLEMSTIQKLFITHYRCCTCKLLPLYRLDLSHLKKVRCGRCGQLVSLTNSGKYGRIRKKLALMLWRARCEQEFVQ